MWAEGAGFIFVCAHIVTGGGCRRPEGVGLELKALELAAFLEEREELGGEESDRVLGDVEGIEVFELADAGWERSEAVVPQAEDCQVFNVEEVDGERSKQVV